MKYRYDSQLSERDSLERLASQLPLAMKYKFSQTEDSVTLEFFVTSRIRENVDGFILRLPLGEDARGLNSLTSAGGSWGLNPKTSARLIVLYSPNF